VEITTALNLVLKINPQNCMRHQQGWQEQHHRCNLGQHQDRNQMTKLMAITARTDLALEPIAERTRANTPGYRW
jgi:hypothetical protein